MTVLLLRGILFALLSVRSHIIRTRDIVHVRRAQNRTNRPLFAVHTLFSYPERVLRFFQPISISLFEFHFSLSE